MFGMFLGVSGGLEVLKVPKVLTGLRVLGVWTMDFGPILRILKGVSHLQNNPKP